MQVIRKLLTAIVIAGVTLSVAAQVTQARGKATLAYKGKTVPADIKAKAVLNAQLKAVEFYYAEAGETEASNFDAIRDKIVETPDRYILDTTILSEDDNTGSQQYTVAVRVALNVANLRNDIKAGSAIGKATRKERSSLAFLFISREVDSEKAFDTRVTKRADETVRLDTANNAQQKGSEGELIRRRQVNTNSSVSGSSSQTATASVVTESGGTRTRRSSESTWRLFPSANLNQIFTSTFSRAGYKVNEASFVEPYTGGRFKVSSVEDDYRSGNDLKSTTLQSIAAGMKTANIPFVAIGTLDVGLADQDPATGMQRVAVTVNARILDVTESIPDTIASVGPVQYAGVGPTEAEARNNALRLAANNAARDLSSQLTSLGLK
jgi:hypothetical protein